MNTCTRIFTLVALALMFPLASMADDTLEETRNMPPEGQVLIENLAGSVEVSAWDRTEVHIRGELGDDVEKVEISETSTGIQIRVRNKSGTRNIDGTDLYLNVPEAASVEVESVSADIRINGSKGKNLVINTISGDVEVASAPGRLEIHSVSGDVEFEGSVARTSIETVSGEIELGGLDGVISGEISVNTVSGDVSLVAGDVKRGRFESVSGDLTLLLSVVDGGRVGCDSMSGDIGLKLPGQQQASFTAQTYSGDIHTDFGESDQFSRGPGSILEYKQGNSGSSIRLESFSGDIHIRSQ